MSRGQFPVRLQSPLSAKGICVVNYVGYQKSTSYKDAFIYML
jgi:hypothetical protein